MTLVQMEDELKDLIEEDPKNPEVYNKIYKLSEYYLNWRKLLTNGSDVAEVAMIMAEDLYMKIYNGGHINSWIGYMRLYCKAAIRIWRKMTASEIIDTSYNLELAESIVLMSTSYPISFEDDRILDRLYFDNIPSVIDNIMQDICRYQEDTKDYLNCKLSILLSLNAGRFIGYSLNNESRSYTRLLYNIILNRVLSSIKSTSGIKRSEGTLSLLQLYTISNSDKEW